MNREIVFRGKRIDNGQWAEGSYCHAEKLDRSGDEHFIIEYSANGSSHRVNPTTVGQYTGLKDKNGRRIFEGDIVKCKGEGRICKVGYYTSPAYCGYDLYAVGNLKALPPHSWEFLDGLKVIGNIHDNPEWLEVR